MHALSRVWLFCNPMDCSLPGSSVHGILQARMLEWVAMPSSRGSSRSWEPASPASPALQTDSLPLSHWRRPEGTINRTFFFFFASLPSMIAPKGYRFEAISRWSAHIVPAGETTGISTPRVNAVMTLLWMRSRLRGAWWFISYSLQDAEVQLLKWFKLNNSTKFFFIFSFLLYSVACRILVLQPGIQPAPSPESKPRLLGKSPQNSLTI